MRATLSTALAAWLLLLLSAGASLPAGAEECAGRTSAIGVSRIVEIDTASGPRFGVQYKDSPDLLEPGEIVLTFDDGPLRPYTRPVLEALAAHCTKATFFPVGRMAAADPEMVKEMVRRGHTVGAHTWSHVNLKTLLPQRAIGEIELGFSMVRLAAGVPITPFFRFPYLSDPKAMIAHLQGRGVAIFSIDVDSFDFRTRNPNDVHRAIVRQLTTRGKGILLFHDIQPSTARALTGLLDELKARGFRVVHLVSKNPVTTLVTYDAQAEQTLAKKRTAESAQPLAKRSIVWPMMLVAPEAAPPTQPAAAPDVTPTGVTYKPSARGQARNRDQRRSSPQEPAAPEADGTEPAEPGEQPGAQQSGEAPWQVRVFGK